MAKELDSLLVQARRIAEHREQGAEEAIRKEFKKLLKSLKAYIGEVHEKYAAGDGTLSFADLQKAGYDARFLAEIEKRIGVATSRAAGELRRLVGDTYELSYQSMIEGVAKVMDGADLGEAFADAVSITPEQIRKAVKNPIMDVALEKHHRDIVYDIKRAVAVGLMNGDRYTTVAKQITAALDKENGPYKNAIRIARTEVHRVREAGNNDAAVAVDQELQNGTTGMRMCKTWKTMKDERVRPQQRRRSKKGWSTRLGKGANHMRLEGQTVLAEENFDLLDGYRAPCPGSSGVAGHDINCRCYASMAMLTDEEFYARTGKHFPGWKKKQENEQEQSNSDRDEKMYPCELGGAKRGRKMGFEEADSHNVNPNYRKEPGYSTNCQSCVVVFEARQRGYDVHTLPNTRGSMLSQLSRQTNLAWIDPATGKHPEYIMDAMKVIGTPVTSANKAFTPKTYLKWLNGIIEQGKRYTLQFGWKGRNSGGHIVNLDRTASGLLRIKDNQRGKSYNGGWEKDEWIGDAEVLEYLKNLKYAQTIYGTEYHNGPKVLRIDNMQFDLDVVNKIMKGSGK